MATAPATTAENTNANTVPPVVVKLLPERIIAMQDSRQRLLNEKGPGPAVNMRDVLRNSDEPPDNDGDNNQGSDRNDRHNQRDV